MLLDDYSCVSNTNCNILKVTDWQPNTTNCPTNSSPICDAFNFNVTNTGIDAKTQFPDNNYDCLLSTPNSSWFHFTVGNSGNLNFILTASSDIDYIVYGPFTSLENANAACGNYGNSGGGNVIDCGFSTAATEFVDITGAISNQVYVILITNFSGATQSIDVSAPTNGTGTFSCAALGLESFENDLISIYPNPFHDVIEMKLNTDAVIKIHDFTGKEILSKNYSANNKKVDLSELKIGTYIMKVTTAEGLTRISKIVKL
ncbi:T9SS type A sorting domain-containing protein [Flavobacterium amnicola]|uniref:T9SS type A sorting domain-containing protein n=1 Tax=Flavobacterium amnicola TaxID=2506422 RepID=A0A4Q1K7P6_9FLAO|nr:T9SS type A sorting domain-containing protein [Flavobacterium amnicola]RXR20589.1 T9SS type A sorting domain-containing protein [Flavobacterium amnicola]